MKLTKEEREIRDKAMYEEYLEGRKYMGKIQAVKYGLSIDQYYARIDKMRGSKRKPRTTVSPSPNPVVR